MAKGDTKTNQYLDIAANGTRADLPSDTCCETRTQSLIRGVAERVMDVEDEVERLENNPDVVDIVATYADLQNYDTSTLTDKDIIRVLQDETHDGDSTYYRYNAQSNTWTYVGESKQYEDFVGTDGTIAGEAGLVPAPAATDVDKFLKSDGTWATAGGGGSSYDVYSTKTTSNTTNGGAIYLGALNANQEQVADPTTTDNHYKYFWALPYNTRRPGDRSIIIGSEVASNNVYGAISIGFNAQVSDTASSSVCIGGQYSRAQEGVAIGASAITSAKPGAIAIGAHSKANGFGSIALGYQSEATQDGEINISSTNTSFGYGNTNFRVIRGLHDGEQANDAVTVSQVNSVIDAINTALSTNIPHIGA